jgi:hypothetical protein
LQSRVWLNKECAVRGTHLAFADLFVVIGLGLCLAGCQGPEGPTGTVGENGADGTNGTTGQDGKSGTNGSNGQDGKNGTDGKDYTTLSYVGSSTCKTCHATVYATWAKTGHASALTAVSGAKPTDPPYSSFPTNPPKDDSATQYSWSEVPYVIGGYGWKALFLDKDGYLITGSKTQYTLASSSYTSYESSTSVGTLKFDCGKCHATGYSSSASSQGGLKGIVGGWKEEGVGCEACHGAGSRHVAAKGLEPLSVDRSPTLCGRCHSRDKAAVIDAQDSFVMQNQQWDEMYMTKKKVMACSDCHDTHQSATYADSSVGNSGQGILTTCSDCHFVEAGKAAVSQHASSTYGPGCIDCHMTKLGMSASGDSSKYAGDLRTHLFRINTSSTASQFSTDGKSAKPYITIAWACKQCHLAGGPGLVLTDAQLEAAAAGYHQ